MFLVYLDVFIGIKAGRLIETRHKLNERNEVVIARNTYDELGRLISEQANGQEGLQTDYSYNIRSWTTNLNNSVYRESIEYNNIGNVIYMNEYRHSKRPQYYWEVSMEYDDLSRMTSYADAGYGAAPTTFFEYDKHGNIIYIDRSGVTAEDSYDSCDELTITHSGNQVQSVVDATDCSETYYSYDFRNLTGVGTSASYEYDLNGAVTKDPYKGATIINNSLNLPQQITVNNNLASGSITYVYLATGEKIMASSSVSLRRSLNPAEIAGGVSTMASTDRDEATFYFGNIIYKTTPEGEPYLDKILIDNGYIKDGEYYFYIKDHLGNNRATAFSTGSVKGMDDYFPYGMPVIDSKWGKNPQAYRFGGKELERLMGLNLYDFQARWHDPALGRFMSVDPLCEKYYSISPYAYCMNNPIKYIDPNGKDWIVANGTSNYEWRNDITAESTIPKGYQYVGANDSDILSHLGLPTSFLEYSSNRIGSIASDAEVGRYAVSHMINVKEKSNATIDVNVSYTREGRIFNGVEIKVTNVSSNSGLDGNIENVGLVNVQYGDKAYTSTLKTPDSPQLLEAGSSVKTSTVNIPKLDLYRGNDFLQIKVEGNWWITTPGGKTPIVAHPVAPIPISFKHLWTK